MLLEGLELKTLRVPSAAPPDGLLWVVQDPAQGSIEELRAGIPSEAGAKSTLEQIFLSIVGQSGAEQAQLEELSWLT